MSKNKNQDFVSLDKIDARAKITIASQISFPVLVNARIDCGYPYSFYLFPFGINKGTKLLVSLFHHLSSIDPLYSFSLEILIARTSYHSSLD